MKRLIIAVLFVLTVAHGLHGVTTFKGKIVLMDNGCGQDGYLPADHLLVSNNLVGYNDLELLTCHHHRHNRMKI